MKVKSSKWLEENEKGTIEQYQQKTLKEYVGSCPTGQLFD